MGDNDIIIGNFRLKCHSTNTLVVGSGAAALNAAVSLHRAGIKDVVIATSQWGGGTSRNAGSDKQTYYKLSLCGDEPDSVMQMARDLFAGHCMHGDIALCEAQGSVQAFMNLVALGVPFPHDTYGSWAGYKTDHDPRARATSAGPYTSKMMFEALAAETGRRGIKVLDRHHVVALLTSASGDSVTGALAIDLSVTDCKKAFVLFNATNIVLGTGGPAGIYESSVYPLSQEGSTGMAFLAGASGQNLTESQFGIASVKFRWNLSGSYQQVMPRYFSAEKDGSDEKEFLNGHFPDYGKMLEAVFLKGYQWPFDPAKVAGYGSSLIDVLVDNEIRGKGRNVFIDFRRNPSWNDGVKYSNDKAGSEVYSYLQKSGALKDTPLERLLSMNPDAVALYYDHGIDLAHEPLQVAVCAQHNNGGLKGDIWWESDLRHLFPVGEVNGTHGVYRPGGSALNSGQAGSFRAAQYISKRYRQEPPPSEDFIRNSGRNAEKALALAEKWLLNAGGRNVDDIISEVRHRMSSCAGIRRETAAVANAFSEAGKLLKNIGNELSATGTESLAGAFRAFDNCITHYVYLGALKAYLDAGGRSRGSYIAGLSPHGEPELCLYDRDVEKNILEVQLDNDEVVTKSVEVRGIPVQDLWFERVWRDYREDNWTGS